MLPEQWFHGCKLYQRVMTVMLPEQWFHGCKLYQRVMTVHVT